MTNLQKDILTGLTFMTGLVGFFLRRIHYFIRFIGCYYGSQQYQY